MTPLLVITNVPERAVAERIAETLVAERLAACINILADTHSVYRWKGAVEHATEFTMMIKIAEQGYPALEARICELHPYELPEIIAVPISLGLPAYLDWIAQASTAA